MDINDLIMEFCEKPVMVICEVQVRVHDEPAWQREMPAISDGTLVS